MQQYAYRSANLFGIVVILDHTVKIVDQLVIVFDMFYATGMDNVTSTFNRSMLTRKRVSSG
jgi:hypothetical protein